MCQNNKNDAHVKCDSTQNTPLPPPADQTPPPPPTKQEIERAKECPIIPPPNLDLIPTALRNLDHWLIWTWDWSYGRKCWAKVPVWNWVDRTRKSRPAHAD